MTVSLEQTSVAVTPTGSVDVRVVAKFDRPVSDVSVRFRVLRVATGKLLLQKTVSRSSLPSGTVSIPYVRSLVGLDLPESRLYVEAVVTADSRPPVTLRDRVFVVRPAHKPATVVLVPRFTCPPSFDPDGRFFVDPALDTAARDQLKALLSLVSRTPRLTASIGLPPILLDEWRRVQAGYETTGAAGVHSVPKDNPAAASYTGTLQQLRDAVAAGRVELLDVPFAEPDMAGLQSIGGLGDLSAHYARGQSIYQVSVAATPSAFTALLGDSVSAAAAGVFAQQRIASVLLRPSSVVTAEATSPSGVYTLRGTRMRALIIDEPSESLLASRGATADGIMDAVFARLTSQEASEQPLVMPFTLGRGGGSDVARLQATLDALARTGWVRYAKASDAARGRTLAMGTLKVRPYTGAPAPSGYWDAVSRSRKAANAFVAAVGENDPDADAALYDALVAESRCWAGPDNRWHQADLGRAFADAGYARSQTVLGKISVTSQNITLSGAEGKVPLGIRNDSGKTLSVFVVAKGRGSAFPQGSRMPVTLRPADNFVTVPVVLGKGAASDRVTFTIEAGSVPLAATTVELRGSYLDRIVIVATVALILIGLLFYIRRNARAVEADT